MLTILSIRFGASIKIYDYLLKNITIHASNPVVLRVGMRLYYVTGLYSYQPVTITNIYQSVNLPSHVKKYIEITDHRLRVIGQPITTEMYCQIKRNLSIEAMKVIKEYNARIKNQKKIKF